MKLIYLVSKAEPKPLSIGDAQDVAKTAYTRAKAAQRGLMSSMHLIELLYRPGMVSYARLRGERSEARKQLAKAQSVVDALDEAIGAMEATVPTEGV